MTCQTVTVPGPDGTGGGDGQGDGFDSGVMVIAALGIAGMAIGGNR